MALRHARKRLHPVRERPASALPLLEDIKGISDPAALGIRLAKAMPKGDPYRTAAPPKRPSDEVLDALIIDFSAKEKRLRLSDSLLPFLSVTAGATGALVFGGLVASALSAATYSAIHMSFNALARRRLGDQLSDAYAAITDRIGLLGRGH